MGWATKLVDARAGQALLLTLTVWFGFVYGSYIVSQLIVGKAGFVHDLPLDIPAVLLVALAALPLYPLAVHTADWRPLPRWLTLFAAAGVLAFVQSIINLGENLLLGVVPAVTPEYYALIRTRFARNFLSHIHVSFANGALFVFLVEARRLGEQRALLAEAEVRAADARTEALRLQINPHFLFNTLNSVSALVVTRRADEAEEMIARLSDFLRGTLAIEPGALVSLAEELETIGDYLAIEAVRFGDRLRVRFDCDPAIGRLPVPGFLLQPLIENAIKYAVARSTAPVTITVSAQADGGVARLAVRDEAACETAAAPSGAPPVGMGIGLANVRRRLDTHFGAAARLEVARGAGGFTATVVLPVPASAGAVDERCQRREDDRGRGEADLHVAGAVAGTEAGRQRT